MTPRDQVLARLAALEAERVALLELLRRMTRPVAAAAGKPSKEN